ncbi:MAG: hypothetical protein EBR81_04405 [Proteobacteria bacterium]|nr:hypothetical protein [Pseudomonadota bacterium]
MPGALFDFPKQRADKWKGFRERLCRARALKCLSPALSRALKCLSPALSPALALDGWVRGKVLALKSGRKFKDGEIPANPQWESMS